MIANKLKEIEAARATIAALEKSVAAEMKAELAGLPGKYGFTNVNDFVTAVQAAVPARRGRGKAKAAAEPKAAVVAKAAGGKKRRKRAVITDATRAELKKLVQAGKSGGEIAEALGISLPSVQNIKKILGLVKARKKK